MTGLRGDIVNFCFLELIKREDDQNDRVDAEVWFLWNKMNSHSTLYEYASKRLCGLSRIPGLDINGIVSAFIKICTEIVHMAKT